MSDEPTLWPTVVALSGDAQIGSATARAARRAAGALAASRPTQPVVVEIDLANVSARPEDLRRVVLGAEAIVVATPTHRGWPTPLLLDFLGGFSLGELRGVPATVLVTGEQAGAAERKLVEYLEQLGADVTGERAAQAAA
ncbi:MAG: NAD(P)H-dependent oxidoreductase [Solirubrobacteraceae bacterium]|nr:NAD(P)H-dependent oxidoreductase [Solirubrobacteraceae bacterium]